MNSARFIEMQCDKLKPAIRSKRRGLLSESGVLLHDNAHSHTAAHTDETLKKLNFEVLKHRPCGPDLATSDCHLFGPLQQALKGCRQFIMDQQLKATVICGLSLSQKLFIPRAQRRLGSGGPSASKSKETILKIDGLMRSVPLF